MGRGLALVAIGVRAASAVMHVKEKAKKSSFMLITKDAC